MKWNKAGLAVMSLMFFIGLATAAFAQQDEEETGKRDIIKNRTYIGIVGTSATIDQWGDFQGLFSFHSISGASPFIEQDTVPSITRNFGWGVILGHREGPWAAEMSFSQSEHTAVYTGGTAVTITHPASLNSIDFDFKRYFFTASPAQPFVSLGMSFPWLWIRQGSYLLDSSGNTLETADETISGIGLNLGAGIEIYLNQDISLLGGAFQRWTGFDQINGVAKIPFNQMYFDGNPADIGAIEGDGLHLYAGATFGFQM